MANIKTTWVLVILVAAIGIVMFSGCVEGPEKQQNLTKETRIFMDDLNRTVEIPKNTQRIIALTTADIEILFLINASDRLVGRPSHIRYPPEALKIDDVGEWRPMNLEKIIAKKPDLVIVTTTLKEEYIKQIKQLELYNITVLAFDYPDLMDEILHHMKVIGDIVGKEEETEKVIKNMKNRIEKIKNKTSKIDEFKKPSVYQEWIIRGKGYSWGKGSRENELIKMAGGKNIFADVEKKYFEANFEEVIGKNPEVIIITVNLEKFNKSEIIEAVKARPGWKNINAVKNNRICVVEEQLTWANPRLVLGLEEFAKCIHPGLFENETGKKQS